MPKISKAQGASYGDENESGQGGPPEAASPDGPVGVPAAPPQGVGSPAPLDPPSGDTLGSSPPGETPAGSVSDDRKRPIVNAPKSEHVAYAAATYGNDTSWWEDEYSKRGLIAVLDELEAGKAEFRDGKVVTMTDENTPDPGDEPEVPDPGVPGDGDNDGTAGEGDDDDAPGSDPV